MIKIAFPICLFFCYLFKMYLSDQVEGRGEESSQQYQAQESFDDKSKHCNITNR
jgi:hypothetical protein